MASAIFLQSSSLSYTFLPLLSRRASHPANLRRFHNFSSTGRLCLSEVLKRPPLMDVSVQAKRGFSSKEIEVASPSDLVFEPPLKIVEYPDPILRAMNKRIDTFDDNLKKLVDEMFDVMYKTDGIGLSAPQVGINVRLMVFNPAGERGVGEEMVLINPRVSKFSKKRVSFEEGCLSFPGINADVVRPESVKVDARDITGARFTVSLSGLPARVFQHEFDHLEGTLFFDRMTEEIVDSIRAELQALEKKYEDKTGIPSPEKVDTRRRLRVVVGFGKS
ncbi:Formylmethionine deformylase [Macleaya cordata]|uniref:Peptide deformylase n=1 Tax=Macleaya cordata TaxID=56857 RepID=A0A200RDD8_MACCD|nr:Formylmethionine deformylase [Macleaya cordata]